MGKWRSLIRAFQHAGLVLEGKNHRPWEPTGVRSACKLRNESAHQDAAVDQSMIPKKPAPDLIRGGYRFSEKIMRQQ
jgi:hypothetical protein